MNAWLALTISSLVLTGFSGCSEEPYFNPNIAVNFVNTGSDSVIIEFWADGKQLRDPAGGRVPVDGGRTTQYRCNGGEGFESVRLVAKDVGEAQVLDEYEWQDIPCGRYVVTIDAEGFMTFTAEQVNDGYEMPDTDRS